MIKNIIMIAMLLLITLVAESREVISAGAGVERMLKSGLDKIVKEGDRCNRVIQCCCGLACEGGICSGSRRV